MILHNGYQIPKKIYAPIFKKLILLEQIAPATLYDLAQKCQSIDPHLSPINVHPLSDLILKQWELIEADGQINETIRSIVTNAVKGTLFSIEVINPIQKCILVHPSS